MRIFEYPYVIITILVIALILIGAIGLYFGMKCINTANSTVEDKGVTGIGRLKRKYRRLLQERKICCVLYADVSLERMTRVYSKIKAAQAFSPIYRTIATALPPRCCGITTLSGVGKLLCIMEYDVTEMRQWIEDCLLKVDQILQANNTVNLVDIHFGYFCTSSAQSPFDEAVSRAKRACEIAAVKDLRLCEWSLANEKELERRIKIENNILSEIENNNFFLEYQPIVDPRTNKIVGAEALSRLNSQGDGIMTPQSFLDAVNSVGLNEKFDYYVFEKNCKWIANNKERREAFMFSTNFSRSTLCNRLFAENVIRIIEKYELRHAALAVEILEDIQLTPEEMNLMSENFATLKKRGITILLDDFGEGYSNLSDLCLLDIDVIKIDRTITQNALTPTGFRVLKNLLTTAKELGLRSLCEGVETEEQKNAVMEAGCDLIQGYYYYQPMPASQLDALLDKAQR